MTPKYEKMMFFDDKYMHISLVHWMLKGVNFSSSSKSNISSSDERMFSAFLQFSPRQSPQAVTHLRPFLRQEHTLVPHRFLEESLHLHHTNLSKVSGAAAMSVMTGVSVVPSRFQPHCSGAKCMSLYVSLFQSITCK